MLKLQIDWIDYGFEVYEPEDVQDYHLEQLYNKIKEEQIRNFQIELAQKFGTENFVKAWNKYVKLDGTFQVQIIYGMLLLIPILN